MVTTIFDGGFEGEPRRIFINFFTFFNFTSEVYSLVVSYQSPVVSPIQRLKVYPAKYAARAAKAANVVDAVVDNIVVDDDKTMLGANFFQVMKCSFLSVLKTKAYLFQ